VAFGVSGRFRQDFEPKSLLALRRRGVFQRFSAESAAEIHDGSKFWGRSAAEPITSMIKSRFTSNGSEIESRQACVSPETDADSRERSRSFQHGQVNQWF